ncbi:hypothetical protein pb186bvf_010193 [Paramecium bursaria]
MSDIYGLYQCINDFYPECYILLLNESLFFSIICLQVLMIVRRWKFGRKQTISILMLVSSSLYLTYQITDGNRYLFFLEQFSISLYQLYLLYYFGLKVIDQKLRVKLYFYFMAVLNIAFLVYFLTQNDQKICRVKLFTFIRTLQLMSQIIFAIITNKLARRMKFNLNPDKTSRRRLSQVRSLTVINLISAFLLLFVNVSYWAHQLVSQDAECRIIQHQGTKGHNWSDLLDQILEQMLIFLTIIVPFFISIIIFIPTKQIKVQEQVSLDIEPINSFYFKDLSIRQ